MSDEIKIGDKVRCFVAVGYEMRPMGTGVITEIRSGYYMVDHCPEGAPWIYAEQWVKKINLTEEGEKENE